jgi:hypothetical protein
LKNSNSCPKHTIFKNISEAQFGFYLPHMEYEINIGLVSRKMKKIIADFHVLGLFIAKKQDLIEKKSGCHAPLPLNAKFVPRLQP